VKDVGKPRKNRKRILRKDTGLIGVPELTEHGVINTGDMQATLTIYQYGY